GVSYALRRLERWDCQFDKRAGNRIGAAWNFSEFGSAGLGGDGYVESCAEYENGAKNGGGSDSSWAARHSGRNCGANSLCRFRPGQLHDRRDHQCKWGLGLVRMRLAIGLIALAVSIGASVPGASAQVAETMMPDASAAKAKQVLNQLISAMG